MVGTALDERGGVAAVLRTWQDHGFFQRWGVRYVPTNGSGGALSKGVYALRAWSRCAWLLAFADIELVHVHTSSYVSFWRKTPVMAMALLFRRPLLVSLHGGGFREFYGARGSLGKAWIRTVMRRARRFVVLTEEWRRWASAVEPRSRVCVIPNPAPHVPELPDGGFRSEPNLLLFLGRVEHEKGLFVLLEALARSRRAGAAWRLVCGGTGDLEAARRAARELGLGPEDVQFLGWIDGGVKHEWLTRCTLLVLPSFIENMPVSVLEAFAYGKPVIATAVGGVPDVVTQDVDGFLGPAGDVDWLHDILRDVYAQPQRLASMGLRGREKLDARYTAQRVLDQADALYGQCLREGAAPTRSMD
jgi:glycosyltransferase involved in cell wall biosynthesis